MFKTNTPRISSNSTVKMANTVWPQAQRNSCRKCHLHGKSPYTLKTVISGDTGVMQACRPCSTCRACQRHRLVLIDNTWLFSACVAALAPCTCRRGIAAACVGCWYAAWPYICAQETFFQMPCARWLHFGLSHVQSISYIIHHYLNLAHANNV